MKVIAKNSGGLAISPQEIVHFIAGETLEAGVKGLSEVNIERLIELKLVTIASDSTENVKFEGETLEAAVADLLEVPEAYEFESIESKEELKEYAREIYSVELDTTKSLAKMIKELKKSIEEVK